ncbi:hypothetical protein Anas_09343 [Armadillidium nasatum]|uniref:Uncharacterized protein n=1 Tax=Armadillidium nasatum TaxID=96803 RepID=A0A5N5T9L7_9CRUS|nr:hypothetical protein Anas_09343 [Armadillidium nasatum]
MEIFIIIIIFYAYSKISLNNDCQICYEKKIQNYISTLFQFYNLESFISLLSNRCRNLILYFNDF